jgi:hypothetical protein
MNFFFSSCCIFFLLIFGKKKKNEKLNNENENAIELIENNTYSCKITEESFKCNIMILKF